MGTGDWAGTRDRLAGLAASPEAAGIFGANGHHWQLEPPLDPDELTELESQLRLRLPGEYRDFLLHAGRGGAGPGYGVFALRRVDGQWRWEGDGADLTDSSALTEPFRHTEAFNPAAGLPEPPDEDEFETVEEFNEAEDAYWEGHDAVVHAPGHSVGLLYLCHLGCALREALVVSGPARGQMWADDTADGGGFRPLLGKGGSRVTFAGWYLGWLAEADHVPGQGR